MTDILLFQPKKENCRDEKIIRIPLGLITASSLLAGEYKIKIIDQRMDKNWKKHLLVELKKKPMIFGTSVTTGDAILTALNASKIVKKHSKVPVVWGGDHVSMFPESTLKNSFIDYGVIGEGEVTFYNLVKALQNNQSLDGIEGVAYKTKEGVKINKRNSFLDLNTLPEIPLHLVDYKEYLKINNNELLIESSRGCPYKCEFCFNKIINKSTRRELNYKNLLNRVERYVNFGAKKLVFSDENLLINLKRIETLCKVLSNFDVTWVGQTSLGILSKLSLKHLKKLKKSGCVVLATGIESLSLNLEKNPKEPQDIIDFNKRIRMVGIKPRYYFILGLPSQKGVALKKDIDLVIRLLKDNDECSLFSFIYVPYIPFFKGDLKKPLKLEDWAKYNRECLTTDNKKEKKLIEDLVYILEYVDRKMEMAIKNRYLSIFPKIYRKLARYRTKHLFFHFFIEKRIFKFIKKFIAI